MDKDEIRKANVDMLERLGSSTDACPNCGSELIPMEGCEKCPSCGFARC